MWEVSENKLMSAGLLWSTGYKKSTDDRFIASDLPKPLFRHPFSGKYDIICLLFDCFFFCASMYEIQSSYLKQLLPVIASYFTLLFRLKTVSKQHAILVRIQELSYFVS